MKSFLVALSLAVTTAAGAADANPKTVPTLHVGESYAIQVMNRTTKTCGPQWIPVEVRSLSALPVPDQLMELFWLQSQRSEWVKTNEVSTIVCGSQKLRAEGKK